jgi:PAS domain S-box-containing protein
VLFDHLPAMMALWDRDLRNVIANQAYVEWFGITPEQMKGIHIREVLGEDVFAMNLPYMRLALAGEEQLFQRTLVDTAGRTRHTQASYVPEVVDGEVLGFYVLVTDVTPRVEAQRQMDEAQQLAELGSWTLIPATQEVIWSAQMYRMAGLDPDSFRPGVDTLPPLVHPEDRDRVTRTAEAAIGTGTGYEMHYRIVRPDGEVREVHSRVRGECAEDGSVTRLTGTLQDVTSSNVIARELTRVNEELRQVNQLNADVLGVVGHDVSQPLGLLLGHLEELSTSWETSPEELRLARVDKALAGAHRLSTLIADILAMANFDSGTIATRPIPVRVGDIVEDALTAVHGGSAVEVHQTEPVAAPLEVVIDPFHLRQMVTNLVANALRYGEPPVTVSIGMREGRVCLEVADCGEGVSESFVPHLFERFTRATTGAAAQKPGSGFGLYVVSRLADANGCRVTYSRREPTGACFRLEVPTVPG